MNLNEDDVQQRAALDESNAALIKDYLASWKYKDPNHIAQFWAEDSVLEMPFAPAEAAEIMPKKIEGHEAIVQWYRDMYVMAGSIDVTIDSLRPLQEPGVMLLEYYENSTTVDGRSFSCPFYAIFRIREGKIVYMKDLFDSKLMIEAFSASNG